MIRHRFSSFLILKPPNGGIGRKVAIVPRRRKESLPAIKQDGKYAVVYLNGRKIRLGRYGTNEAQQEYRRKIAEWLAVGDVSDSHKKESS